MNVHVRGRSRDGMAVLLVIALLAVMCALIVAAAHSLTHLKSELKEIERDQTNRWAASVQARVR
jgi:hypothetical protein